MLNKNFVKLAVVCLPAIMVAGLVIFFNSKIDEGHAHGFVEQYIISGGPIVWLVLIPMSLFTGFLAVDRIIALSPERLMPRGSAEKIKDAIRRNGIEAVTEEVENAQDILSTAVRRALKKGGSDWLRVRSLLNESLFDQAAEISRKIEWLNLIGNVSPMIGLFGTVFGMIKLFDAIVLAGGQPQPAQMASGISVALVTTFWGLFIAIPAIGIHGFLRNRIESIVSDAAVAADEIAPLMCSLLKKGQGDKAQMSGKKVSVNENQIIA